MILDAEAAAGGQGFGMQTFANDLGLFSHRLPAKTEHRSSTQPRQPLASHAAQLMVVVAVFEMPLYILTPPDIPRIVSTARG